MSVPVIIEYVSRETGDTITEATPHPSAEEARLRAIWLTVNGVAKTGSILFKAPAETVPLADAALLQTVADALRNMLGAYDTPVSRRRYPPDAFMQECIQSARDAIELLESR